MITAKVVLTRKDPFDPDVPESQVVLQFQPDYADGRNKEWANATPALSLTMTVKAEAAGHFDEGQPYTLQFVPTED